MLIRTPAFRHSAENQRSLMPLGLAYVAGALRERGHEVTLLDAELGEAHEESRGFTRVGMEDWDIINRVRLASPDAIGLSCMFANAMPMLVHVTKLIRRFYATPIFAGGYAPTSEPEQALAAGVNCVIKGEGEFALADALDRLPAIEPILEQRWEPDLAKYPKPAFDLIDFDAYARFEVVPDGVDERFNGKRAAAVLTSRGCPVGCNFCSVQLVTGTPFRRRTAKDVVDEVEGLVSTYGIEKVHFFDDNLTLNKGHAQGIFREMIERDLGIEWNTTQGTAAWNWDDETLDLAVKSGLQYLILPVESGSDEVLRDLMHKKPLSVSKIEQAVTKARERGLGVQGWAIIGTPGETKAQMDATLSFMNRLDLDYRGAAAATPYPGSDLYDECARNGYIQRPVDFSRLQRGQGIISTPEFSARYVTARLAAWVMNGRLRTGQGLWRSIKRSWEANGFLATLYTLWLAARERRADCAV